MAQSLSRDFEEPQRFKGVVYSSYCFITFLNWLFALLCVMLFGDDPGGMQNPITANLNKGVVAQAIRVLLCFDLLFTIPMVLAVGREVIERSLVDHFTQRYGDSWEGLLRNATRTALVLLITALAFGAVKSSNVNEAFGNVINLMGGFTNVTMGLIIPPLVYRQALVSEATPAPGCVYQGFLMGISVVGVILMITSTYYTIHGILTS